MSTVFSWDDDEQETVFDFEQTPQDLLESELGKYSICPFCGDAVDLSSVNLVEKGAYPYCPCFAESEAWQLQANARSVIPKTKRLPGPIHIKSTYSPHTRQLVLSLVLIAEPDETKGWLWKPHLRVNSTALGEDDEFITLETTHLPDQEATNLIFVLRDVAKFIALVEASLRDGSCEVYPETVSKVQELIDQLKFQLTND